MSSRFKVHILAAANFALAISCGVGILLLTGAQIYGVFFSGDPPDELRAGIFGSLLFILPLMLGGVVFLLAAIGLLCRSKWGYYAQIVAALIATLTVAGLLYSVPALVLLLQPSFRAEFFRT